VELLVLVVTILAAQAVVAVKATGKAIPITVAGVVTIITVVTTTKKVVLLEVVEAVTTITATTITTVVTNKEVVDGVHADLMAMKEQIPMEEEQEVDSDTIAMIVTVAVIKHKDNIVNAEIVKVVITITIATTTMIVNEVITNIDHQIVPLIKPLPTMHLRMLLQQRDQAMLTLLAEVALLAA